MVLECELQPLELHEEDLVQAGGQVVTCLAEQWEGVVVREEEGGWYVDMQPYCQGCEVCVLGTPSPEEMGTVFVTQVTETKEEPLYSDPETRNIHRLTL
jgi:hypothetical protein